MQFNYHWILVMFTHCVNMFTASTSEIYTILEKNHRLLFILPAIYSCSDKQPVINSFIFGRKFSYSYVIIHL